MTREQLDDLEKLNSDLPGLLSLSGEVMSQLISLSREALELREALEYVFSDDVLEISGSRCYPVEYVAHIVTVDGVDHEGEDSTPLEAINNARRRM